MFAARQQAQLEKTKSTASPKAKKVAAIKPQFKALSKKSSFVTPFAKKDDTIKKSPQKGLSSPKASPKRSPKRSPKCSPKQSPKLVNKNLDKVKDTGKNSADSLNVFPDFWRMFELTPSPCF